MAKVLIQAIQRATFTLADAQFVIAREHGFDSWPKFVKHIESATEQRPSDRIWNAVKRAVVTGDVTTLGALLREHGELLRTGAARPRGWWRR